MEQLGLNLGYLLVQIFNFLIIFFVLRAWVYYPVLDLLERRRTTIAQGLEDARVAAEARENAEEEARKILADAQAEVNDKIREASERAQAAATEIRQEAETEAARAREEAIQDAEQDRNRILADMRGQVASLAIAAAEKLLRDNLDEKRQHQLIQEFFSGIKSGKVQILEDSQISGGSAQVISALPLTEQEKETIRTDILSRLGSQATVTFRVDPSILGGLVIKVGDRVLDGTVSSRLEEMRQNLS